MRSISCCTDASMISELNETQTHHFQEETERFCVAPDGFLSELSSKKEGTGIKSRTTERKCVFRLHVFDSGRRYLNKM